MGDFLILSCCLRRNGVCSTVLRLKSVSNGEFSISSTDRYCPEMEKSQLATNCIPDSVDTTGIIYEVPGTSLVRYYLLIRRIRKSLLNVSIDGTYLPFSPTRFAAARQHNITAETSSVSQHSK